MLKYFLPIGIDRYQHIAPRLRFAASDAECLSRLFEGLGYATEPVWRDEDFGYGSGVTRDLGLHLNTLGQRFAAAGGGLLVIYLAGHGATNDKGDPILFKPHGRPEDLDNPRAHSYIHVPEDLIKPTASWPQVQVLVMLDNCRTEADTLKEGDVLARGPGLNPGFRPKAWLGASLLFSAPPGQQSFELGEKAGGLFRLAITPVLQELMEKPRRLGAEALCRLGALRMTEEARGHAQAEILVAQQPDYRGPDIELLSERDCDQLNALRRDRDLLEQARLFPDRREVWLMARRGLSADSPLIAEVEEKLRSFRLADEDKAYAAALKANDLQGWRQFKAAYPESVRLGEVEKEIAQLEAAEAEAKAAAERKAKAEAEAKMKAKAEGKAKAAAEAKAREELERKAKEEEAWKVARVGGVVELKGFLEEYQASQYRVEAEKLLKSLEAAEAEASLWKIASTQGSAEAYQNYLRVYPAGIYAGEAKGRLEALKKDDETSPKRKLKWLDDLVGYLMLAGLAVLAGKAVLGGALNIDGWNAKKVNGLQEATALILRLRSALGLGAPLSIRLSDPQSIKECTVCPEMVLVPAGKYTMGSPEEEADRESDEGPQHEVRIGRPLLVGKYEVTFAEWDACVAEGACQRTDEVAKDEWGRGRQPVMRVSWKDIDEQYLPWLNRKAGLSGKPKGEQYRLLSESEWEYAARAGTTGPYNFEGEISPAKVNYNSNYSYGGSAKDASGYRKQTVEVGSLPGNRWGLHEMHGNVYEWVGDCWNGSYSGAPDDGSAWQSGDCKQRVLRGGSWCDRPWSTRTANRISFTTAYRFSYFGGFRVARMLP